MSLRMVVGLGNVGMGVIRHNAGAMLVSSMVHHLEVNWHTELQYEYAEWTKPKSDQRLLFLKPRTFMNIIGFNVRHAMIRFRVQPQQMLVVHDDLDKQFGVVTMKEGGSHGGHKGVLSVMTEARSPQFYRLRVGIGRPPDQADVPRYVLQNFSRSQQDELNGPIRERAWHLIWKWMDEQEGQKGPAQTKR